MNALFIESHNERIRNMLDQSILKRTLILGIGHCGALHYYVI